MTDEQEIERLLIEWRTWKRTWLNGLASGFCLALVCVFAWMAVQS